MRTPRLRKNEGEKMRGRFGWLLGLLLLVIVSLSSAAQAAGQAPLLASRPTMNKSTIVFLYGGYLWSVPRDGGLARQLTTEGHETLPSFSPDGKWIAFTGEYDGNGDVYVMPAEGGTPKRLTWHPGYDAVVGWTPDGKKIIFSSALYHLAGRRCAGSASHVAGGMGFVLAGRDAHGVRAEFEMAGSLETLPRRSDHAHLRHRAGHTEFRKNSPRQFQRLQPAVGRRHGLFSLRPQRPEHTFCLRHKNETSEAGDRKQGAGSEVDFRRRRWHRLRAIRRHLHLRSSQRDLQTGQHPGRGRFAGHPSTLGEGRRQNSKRFHFAEWSAGRVRSTRRNPQCAARKRRYTQSDADHHGCGTFAGLVAGWQMDCVFLR